MESTGEKCIEPFKSWRMGERDWGQATDKNWESPKSAGLSEVEEDSGWGSCGLDPIY